MKQNRNRRVARLPRCRPRIFQLPARRATGTCPDESGVSPVLATCHGHPARARAWPGWPWHKSKRPLIRPRPSATFSPREKEERLFPLPGERVAAMCRRVRGLFPNLWPRRGVAQGQATPHLARAGCSCYSGAVCTSIRAIPLPDVNLIAAYSIFIASYFVFALGKFPGLKIDRPGRGDYRRRGHGGIPHRARRAKPCISSTSPPSSCSFP